MLDLGLLHLLLQSTPFSSHSYPSVILLIFNMASTFFTWLRSPAAREYFFSVYRFFENAVPLTDTLGVNRYTLLGSGWYFIS